MSEWQRGRDREGKTTTILACVESLLSRSLRFFSLLGWLSKSKKLRLVFATSLLAFFMNNLFFRSSPLFHSRSIHKNRLNDVYMPISYV